MTSQVQSNTLHLCPKVIFTFLWSIFHQESYQDSNISFYHHQSRKHDRIYVQLEERIRFHSDKWLQGKFIHKDEILWALFLHYWPRGPCFKIKTVLNQRWGLLKLCLLFSLLYWMSPLCMEDMFISVSLIYEMESLQNTLINTLRPRQNGCHFADDIFRCIF